MVQITRGDAQPANLEGTLGEGMVADGGAKLLDSNGEIGVGHLPRQQRLQGLPRAPWPVDVPLVSRCKQRCEEGQALDVIPVHVGEQQMAAHRTASRSQQGLPECLCPCTTIEDYYLLVSRAYFDARGIPAVAHGRRAWLR